MRPASHHPEPCLLPHKCGVPGLSACALLFLATTTLVLAQPSPPSPGGAGSVAIVRAQPSAAPPRDPMMALMTSQPQIEISSSPTATASFDPPIVRPGEPTLYRIVFNALEESIDWPGKISAPPQLEVRPGAQGQMLQMAGANLDPRTSFNLRVRASSLGVFTMPSFTVKVYGKPVTVPAVPLAVVADPPATGQPRPRLLLDLPATNLYVGQAVSVRLILPGMPGGVVQGLAQPQISGRGFLVDLGSARQRIDMMPQFGANVPSFICETTLTPIMTGKLSIFAQGFTAGNRFFGPIVITGAATIPGGPPQYTLLESDPIELNVRPLPSEGVLPGFSGAIGSFAVGTPKLETDVLRVGDPVRLTVMVTNLGDGPLARLVSPPPPQVRDWQIFASSSFATAQIMSPTRPGIWLPPVAGPGSVAVFNYTLIPLTEAARATPAIPFSAFDPGTGRYTDLTIASVPVTVQPGASPGDLQALLQPASTAEQPEKELLLSGLAVSRGRTAASLVPPQQQAWFPLIQLAPAALFFGLWKWDRRRRYLQQHPDVILRRRARRALRHQWRILRRAGRAADAPRFATSAVSALRVACAPHYPAEARALVGADVLPLLPESDRNGRPGEVIRRFFDVTDAIAFSTAPQNPADLLPLQPDLERVLQQLEERL